MQCHWQLFGLLMAQTFLKGLSRSWRSSELPSRGRWVVMWAVCLLLRKSLCVFAHTHLYSSHSIPQLQEPVIDN